MTVRVMLLDDDPLVLAGLRVLLAGDPDITVVAAIDDGGTAVDTVAATTPDVVLLDIRMAMVDGITVLQRIRAMPDPPAVVMLTTIGAESVVLEALRAGAAGFLVKHTPPERIVAAIHSAAAGEITVSAGVLRQLVNRATAATRTDELDRLAGLTDREREVAQAVAEGLGNTEIAAKLHLSVGSVKAHVSSSLAKLGLDNRVQLAIAAHESGS